MDSPQLVSSPTPSLTPWSEPKQVPQVQPTDAISQAGLDENKHHLGRHMLEAAVQSGRTGWVGGGSRFSDMST